MMRPAETVHMFQALAHCIPQKYTARVHVTGCRHVCAVDLGGYTKLYFCHWLEQLSQQRFVHVPAPLHPVMKRSRTHLFATADDAVLSLNVGGARFQMSRDTAARIPYFRPFLEGRFDFTRDDDGWIFVDRCGELFKHMLQFARDARRPSRSVLAEHRHALLAECDFFGFEALAHHLREDTCPWDLRVEDRRIREAELGGLGAEPNTGQLVDFFAADHSPLEREGLQLNVLLGAQPRATVAGDFDAFYQRLEDFSGGVLRKLADMTDVVVAGGAVVGALVNATSSDLDLFLVCEAREAETRLKRIFGIVQRSLRERCGGHGKLLVTRSAAAVTFHHSSHAGGVETPPVQVVLGLGRSLADVLQRFDVDCCCVAFDPTTCKVLCTQRGLRALRYSTNVVDSGFGGPGYARRLQKYAERGFAAAVPYFSPDRASPELWRSSHMYFERSGLLLRLGRHASVSDAPEKWIQAIACRRATVVENLARLVVLDAGAPTVNYRDNDRIRPGEFVCVPMPTGETGEYIVATGRVLAAAVEPAATPEESDLYVSLAGLIPGILEKACQVDEQREDPPTPEGWRAGGVVRRAAGKGVAAVKGEEAVAHGHEEIVCVYDLVTRGAAFDSLRYVLDARQPPLNAMSVERFERRYAFPAALAWRRQKTRVGVREFTRDVYI